MTKVQNPVLSPKYLILTSSGGGGHIAAAKAKFAELASKGIPKEQIEVIDLMGLDSSIATNKGKSWLPTISNPITGAVYFSGEANTEKWDALQKKGGVEAVRDLEKLVALQWIAENIQSGTVYNNMKEYLATYDVQEIYDTQALSTPAICQAIKEKNDALSHQSSEREPKKLKVTKIVTEFLTHRAVHFLDPLSRIKPEHREVMEVQVVQPPLLGPSEKLEDFTARHSVDNIKFTFLSEKRIDPPVRSAFKSDYTNPPKIIIKGLSDADIGTINKTELQKINEKYPENSAKVEQEYRKVKMLEEGSVLGKQLQNIAKLENNDFTIDKKKDDKLITITLGSQGSSAVLSYVDSFIEQALQSSNNKGNVYLCLAVGKNQGEDSLYAKTQKHINDRMEQLRSEGRAIPENVKILPLAFQDEKHMASLLQNSDVLITRTGGMSSIEAEYTQRNNKNRKVFLHSEAITSEPFPKHNYDAVYEGLMGGTVKWEGGNAEFLMKNIGASLGNPQTIDFGISGNESSLSSAHSLFHIAYEHKLNSENHALIQELIYEGSNPNLKFPDNSLLIEHAGDFATKELLVSNGARITPKVLQGLSDTQQKTLRILSSRFKEDNRRLSDKAHLEFTNAIKGGELKKIKGLLYNFNSLKNEQINIDGNNYVTPLQLAIKHNQIEALKLLLEYRVEIDKVNDFGAALHLAVQENNLEAAKALITSGVNPYVKHKGKMAHELLEGKDSNYLPMLHLFIKEKVLNPEEDKLPLVIGKKAEDINKFMYEKDNKYNNSPLHIAVFNKVEIGKMTEILSENIKNINSLNANGQTALSLCDNQEIRRLMVKYGADIGYLPDNLTRAEVQELQEISFQHKTLIKNTRSMIMTEFKRSKGDREEFVSTITQKFQNFYVAQGDVFEDEAKQRIEERWQKVHENLMNARNEEKKLGILDKVINFSAKIVGASKFDLALKSISKEARKETKQENRTRVGLNLDLISQAQDITRGLNERIFTEVKQNNTIDHKKQSKHPASSRNF